MTIGKVRVVLLIALVSSLQACGGLELGGKLGMYRVDDRQEQVQVKTINQPLKCLFIPCASDNEASVRGS